MEDTITYNSSIKIVLKEKIKTGADYLSDYIYNSVFNNIFNIKKKAVIIVIPPKSVILSFLPPAACRNLHKINRLGDSRLLE